MRPGYLFILWSLLVTSLAVFAKPIQTPAPVFGLSPRDVTATTTAKATATDPTSTTTETGFHLTLSLNLPSNTCTPTVAPDKNGWVPASQCNALYLYYPSFGTAIAFTILFGLLTMAHLVQATIYKAGFAWVVLMGVAWECVGYITRALSTRNQQDTTIATITQIFILLAPLWVNAYCYMVLARMIYFFIPERQIGIFRPSLLATVFVFLDFGSFIIQIIGGMSASPGQSNEEVMKGIHIYMAGIGIQQFFIICFLVLTIQFHRQMLQLDRSGRLFPEKRRWRHLLYALYGSLLFITVRIIYRLVEFSAGETTANPIPYHEWYMYVFDAVPMLFAIVVWNVAPPGAVLQGPDAKLPPSGLRKLLTCWNCCNLCVCCGCACCCRTCRKREKKRMQRIPDSGGEEMLPLRETSPYR
ncbi:uncharacterized protein N7496_007200 [Penicillium cataractarum]|uniref:RTA1 domain protein n=1 Tax=Penicillium cataractarum TaxID=2100454 RepID=A0A9W9V6V6_9EURO|nr:uncharacterized protein N7496_007200 [Penicillium cataractarum]KAJ5371108.1 hypothetical protein N7496_007200 [Penicillium cataractarum]